MKNQSSAMIVLVVGAVILLASVFAGNIGLANVPALSAQQATGVVIGAVLLAVGFFLNNKSGQNTNKTSPGGDSDAAWLDSLTKAEEIDSDKSADREGQ